MKKLIRRWLGIKEAKEVKEYSIEEMRRMVGDAVETALAGSSDSRWNSYYGISFRTNTLQKALYCASTEQAKIISEQTIRERIYTESFIDEVIDRIKRKQVVC